MARRMPSETSRPWYQHPLICPFAVFLPVEGSERQQQRAIVHNMAHRHLLLQGAVWWMLIAAALWQIGQGLEEGRHMGAAACCFVAVCLLAAGSLVQLAGFFMLGRLFDHRGDR